jgi:hypothetical protein
VTGSTAELSIWEKGAAVSGNNEFSFRANPGKRNFEARFNSAPATQASCKIQVEVKDEDEKPSPTPEQPTPQPTTPPAPTPQPTLPPPPPEPTQPPAIAAD